MIVIKLFTMLVSGYTSLFVIAWAMLAVCVGLSWAVAWQESRR